MAEDRPSESTRRSDRRRRLYGTLVVFEMLGILLVLLCGVVALLYVSPLFNEPAESSPSWRSLTEQRALWTLVLALALLLATSLAELVRRRLRRRWRTDLADFG